MLHQSALVVLFVSLCLPRIALAQQRAKPRRRADEHDIAVVRAPAAQAPTPQPTASCPAPEAPPASVRPTGSVGVSIGVATVNGGAYAARASYWGNGGFNAGVSAAIEGGVYPASWLLVGLRAGLLHSESDAARSDGSTTALDLYDGGLIVRAELPIGAEGVRGVVGLQGELGLQGISLSLRGVDETALGPRAAFLVIGQVIVGRFAFGLRAGQRFGLWWRETDLDFDLGGFEFATGCEVRL